MSVAGRMTPEADPATTAKAADRASLRLVLVIGFTQTLAYVTTFYVPSILIGAVAASMQASPALLLGGFSWALLVNGLAAPRVGRLIDRAGGREVLAAGSGTIACGLTLMAAAPNIVGWYAAWTLMGIGMALGLYDAAFATIGRLLGANARPTIVGVTLMGGFASSIGWSMGWLVDLAGWQETLLIYAAINLGVNLPLVLWLVPRVKRTPAPPATGQERAPSAFPPGTLWMFVLLAVFFSIRSAMTTTFSVHSLALMQGVGLSAAGAVAALALIGPAQVGARILEWFAGRHVSAMTTSLIGAMLLPLGVLAMLLGGPAAVFALAWGISGGVVTISRGVLPMVLFGPVGYASRLGQIALPTLLAQAAAPTLVAPLMAVWPASYVMAGIGAAGLLAFFCLVPLWRAPRSIR